MKITINLLLETIKSTSGIFNNINREDALRARCHEQQGRYNLPSEALLKVKALFRLMIIVVFLFVAVSQTQFAPLPGVSVTTTNTNIKRIITVTIANSQSSCYGLSVCLTNAASAYGQLRVVVWKLHVEL